MFAVSISPMNEGLMYPWMRFIRGVIDSEDLPLISAEKCCNKTQLSAASRQALPKTSG